MVGLRVTLADLNKVDVNSNNTAVYLSGMGGTVKFAVQNNQLAPGVFKEGKLVELPISA
jgi:hypothetical protein